MMTGEAFTGPKCLSIQDVREMQTRFGDPQRLDSHPYRPIAELGENPDQAPDDPLLFVYYVEGKPVARVNTIQDCVIARGQTLKWMWVGNQLTLKSHRGQGLMPRLFQHVIETANERGISIGGAGVMPAGRAVYQKAGLKFWGFAPRRVLLLRSRNLLRQQLRNRFLGDAAALVPDGLLALQRKAIELSLRQRGYRLEVIDNLTEDLSPLFETIPVSFRFSRSFEKMKWRCGRVMGSRGASTRNYRLGLLRDEASGRLAGYVMLRAAEFDRPGGMPADNFRIVTVLDWCTRYGDRPAQAALVAEAIRAAVEMKAEMLEVATTDPGLQSLLRSRSFLAVGGARLFYLGARGSPFENRQPGDLRDWWWNGGDPEDNWTA